MSIVATPLAEHDAIETEEGRMYEVNGDIDLFTQQMATNDLMLGSSFGRKW
jgi:hypothetical protein